MNYAQKVNPWHKPLPLPLPLPPEKAVLHVVDTLPNDKDKDSVLPGWVYIRHGGPKGLYEYKYGPDVYNAYLEDTYQRDAASQYISRRRVWRDQTHIQRMNHTLGDLSPYWYRSTVLPHHHQHHHHHQQPQPQPPFNELDDTN